jgi:hypothetical protein
MLKILIILILIFYVMSKLGFFRAFSQGVNSSSGDRPRPAGGNVNIHSVPKKDTRKPSDFKGGDYIDYEEVK